MNYLPVSIAPGRCDLSAGLLFENFGERHFDIAGAEDAVRGFGEESGRRDPARRASAGSMIQQTGTPISK